MNFKNRIFITQQENYQSASKCIEVVFYIFFTYPYLYNSVYGLADRLIPIRYNRKKNKRSVLLLTNANICSIITNMTDTDLPYNRRPIQPCRRCWRTSGWTGLHTHTNSYRNGRNLERLNRRLFNIKPFLILTVKHFQAVRPCFQSYSC